MNKRKKAKLQIAKIWGGEIMKDIITLSIESSCDETAVAVLKNGREVLANVVST